MHEPDFGAHDLGETLLALDAAQLDDVSFGVVGLADDDTVISYNRWEANLSGLEPARVVGQHFFTQVAPCTNNFMVAERFKETPLDETIGYVFTFRMKPTAVQLRLIANERARFICVRLA